MNHTAVTQIEKESDRHTRAGPVSRGYSGRFIFENGPECVSVVGRCLGRWAPSARTQLQRKRPTGRRRQQS
jgi:hypothetical protein